jgi:hypothetical protein
VSTASLVSVVTSALLEQRDNLGCVSRITGADGKPKLARHTCDGHSTSWDEARVLQIELNIVGT